MRRGGICFLVVLTALLGAAWLGSSSAQAKSPIYQYFTTPSETQAGGHPDILTLFDVGNRYTQNFPSNCFCENAKDIIVSAPTGVIGNPHALPSCSLVDFLIDPQSPRCSPDSQIGIIIVKLGGFEGNSLSIIAPLYNLEPRVGQAGLIGFKDPILKLPLFEDVSARTDSDYGLDVTVEGLTQFATPNATRQIFWGVPADPKNDGLRFPLGSGSAGCIREAENGDFEYPDPTPFVFGEGAKMPDFCGIGAVPPFQPTKSNAQLKPFLSNPTSCGVELTSSLETLAYDGLTDQASASYPPTTGCDQLGFNPSLAASPTTNQADTASGVDVKLSVPQGDSPNVPSASQIRATSVEMPEGFSINPNAADGKTTCTDFEARFGTRQAAACPENAKIGTLELTTSALPGPIAGAIYLGSPKPGERFRLFLTAGGFGTNVKLAGRLTPDPRTGRVTVSFQDLPQSPVTELNMHIFGSERGVLATPTKCGTYAVNSTFVPWNDVLPIQTSTQFFTIDTGAGGRPCPGAQRPFSPDLRAGTGDNTAAAFTPFSLRIGRDDGDQNLSGVSVKTPPGFAGVLRGIPYCPQAAIARVSDPAYSGVLEQTSPSCPVASQVGTVSAGVGAGTHPLYNQGKAYLAGPYRGAPLSLLMVVPAVSGSYDLGNVAVRVALAIDPITAQVSAISDPLPQIIEGLPLRLRSILVNLDRRRFTFNPTNCDPLSVDATLSGSEGAVVARGAPFQVVNCADLDYGPKLTVRLTGGLKRLGHPAIHAVLRTKPSDANSKRVVVTLPAGEQLDISHVGNVCTRPRFAADDCPENSWLGTAEATTPLLDQPLKGNVYLRSSDNQLPDLVADLEGQIEIELAGEIDTTKTGGLRTSFKRIPDAPVTEFRLDLFGGGRGLLINESGLCGAARRASVRMIGQNDATSSGKVKLKAGCGKQRGKRAKRGKGA